MEIRGSVLAFVSLVAACATVNTAAAEPLDPALSRLVLDPRCNPGGALEEDSTIRDRIADRYADNGRGRRDGLCAGDNAAFAKLINQWAMVIAPTAMHPARSTGYGGFHFSLQASYTTIDNGADYWKKGTQGTRDTSSNAAALQGDPPGMIALYSVNARKSFGFGLETGLNLGVVPNSSIIAGGADVRLAILEGFRTQAWGLIPDLSVGAGVRTITGTAEFQLTAVGIDGQLSKRFTLGDSSHLTPMIGYQYLFIFGDSGLVDLTPATDPLGYCNYSGPNVPGNTDDGVFSGQPVCEGGSPLDFNNNTVFQSVRFRRQRLMFGLNYNYEMVTVGAQVLTDLVDPGDAQTSTSNSKRLECDGFGNNCEKSVPRQWTTVLELGVAF